MITRHLSKISNGLQSGYVLAQTDFSQPLRPVGRATHLLVLLSVLGIAVAHCRVDRRLEIPGETTRRVQCNNSGYHVENLCDDEKEYLDWAEAESRAPRMADLNRETLLRFTRETQDVDKAAAVFYTRLIREPLTQQLIAYLESTEKRLEAERRLPDYSDLNVALVVAPGMFYKDNPETGADGSGLRSIAARMGMKDDAIPLEQTGTVEENGALICDYIRNRNDGAALILASASKGGADIKYAIHLCGEDPAFEKVVGWLNIGGINRGSILANEINNQWDARLEARTYFCLNGYNYDGLMSMREGEGAPLNFDLDLPDHLLMINIIGVPVFRFVTERARPYYLHLVQFGPNDGLSLLADLYMPGAVNWGSWRNDHYFRWPISETRMMAFIMFVIEGKRANIPSR
jgi:hypothetical protein